MVRWESVWQVVVRDETKSGDKSLEFFSTAASIARSTSLSTLQVLLNCLAYYILSPQPCHFPITTITRPRRPPLAQPRHPPLAQSHLPPVAWPCRPIIVWLHCPIIVWLLLLPIILTHLPPKPEPAPWQEPIVHISFVARVCLTNRVTQTLCSQSEREIISFEHTQTLLWKSLTLQQDVQSSTNGTLSWICDSSVIVGV